MTPEQLLDLDIDAFRQIVDRDVRHGQRNIEQLDDETRRSLRSPQVVGRWRALLDGIVAQFHRQQEAAASERAAKIAGAEIVAISDIEGALTGHMGPLMSLVNDRKSTLQSLKDAIVEFIGALSAPINDHGTRVAEAERDFHTQRTRAMRILAQHELRASEARAEKERYNPHRLNTLLVEELAEQVRANKRIRAIIERHRNTVQGDETVEPSVADYELWDSIKE